LIGGVSCILEWALVPAAWTFIVTLEDALYGPYFECLGMRRMFDVDCAGRRQTGYGWDRRRFPPPALFEMMARRELTGESGPPPESLLRPAPLSPHDFADAVVAALRELSRPERLTDSPLLGSNVVPPGVPPTAEALRRVVLDAIGSMSSEQRGADHRRVLERTYLKGAPSQEAAAELLGLPFSTYRRHLAKAHGRLTEILWAVETGAGSAPGTGDGQKLSSD
jgi:DNA-directed RNA polymerase specialized sigma24 family protein